MALPGKGQATHAVARSAPPACAVTGCGWTCAQRRVIGQHRGDREDANNGIKMLVTVSVLGDPAHSFQPAGAAARTIVKASRESEVYRYFKELFT